MALPFKCVSSLPICLEDQYLISLPNWRLETFGKQAFAEASLNQSPSPDTFKVKLFWQFVCSMTSPRCTLYSACDHYASTHKWDNCYLNILLLIRRSEITFWKLIPHLRCVSELKCLDIIHYALIIREKLLKKNYNIHCVWPLVL